MKRIICTLFFSFVCLAVQADLGKGATDSLMQKVFSYVERSGLRADDFRADIYVQFGLRTHRKNVFLRWVPGFSRIERGRHDYFGESRVLLHVHPDGKTDAKELALYSTVPGLSATADRILNRYTLSLYDTQLFMGQILSPLHVRNRHYYRYRATGLVHDSLGVAVRMEVRPHFYNTQLVAGTVDVDTLTGAVRHFDFSFYYDMTRIRLTGTPGRTGAATLMPEQMSIGVRYGMLGNKLAANYMAYASYDFPPSRPDSVLPRRQRFDLTEYYRLRWDTINICHDRHYFDSVRRVPLSPGACGVYEQADSMRILAAGQQPDLVAQRRKRTEALFFDRHSWILGQQGQGQVRMPAIITPEMFMWSHSKGFILQTKMRFTLEPPSRRFSFQFYPRVSYSFKQHFFYWRVPLSFTFLPAYDARLTLETGNGNRAYNSRQADAVREQMRGVTGFDSLSTLLSRYDLNLYDDLYSRLDAAFSPVSGLRLSLGFTFHQRTLVGWDEAARQSGLQQRVRSFAPRIHLDWTPCLYYYRQGRRKVPLYSNWPTFRLDYERGIKMGGFRSNYERLEADVQYTRSLYALRSLYLRAGFGCYTHRGGDFFLDYAYFRDDNLPDGWEDHMSGKFYALGSRWYNESDYYLRLSGTYESPMLVFSRLRFLSRIVQKERIYANLVSLNALHPYAELGYGVSTHMLDVSGFIGLARGVRPSFGARLVFHWFDDW